MSIPDDYTRVHITSDDFPAPRCDFCASTPIAWRYPCRTFDMPEIERTLVGDWAACEACSDIIERYSQREAIRLLADRNIARLTDPAPAELQLLLRYQVNTMHGGFFRHRSGPRIPA